MSRKTLPSPQGRLQANSAHHSQKLDFSCRSLTLSIKLSVTRLWTSCCLLRLRCRSCIVSWGRYSNYIQKASGRTYLSPLEAGSNIWDFRLRWCDINFYEKDENWQLWLKTPSVPPPTHAKIYNHKPWRTRIRPHPLAILPNWITHIIPTMPHIYSFFFFPIHSGKLRPAIIQ